MRTIALAGFVVALWAGSAAFGADDVPQPPAPEKEHGWLQQLVGEWETESEMIPGPGQPAQKCRGTESARSLGGFWTMSETKGSFKDVTVTGIMTLGYDPQKKKYVGTWVDSTSHHLWTYEGTLDADGKVLTLETEGPIPGAPGKRAKFKEVLEIKGKDHKVFSSAIRGDDGKWFTFMTANYRRKK